MKFSDTLKNAKKDISEYTEFAVNGIKNVCKLYGPRPCGEESEKNAQLLMQEELNEYADTVTRETFKVNPDAFMSFVPIAGTCLIGSSALNVLSSFKNKKAGALGSFGLIGTALSGITGEFLFYKKMLDPFFKKKESGNVIAIKKATGETKRRIILSGHTDSAPEWTYTYKLGSHGVIIVAGYAIAGLLYTAATSAVALTKNKKAAKYMSLGQLAFLPAYGALYKFTNSKRYVEGANDNLTGCYISTAVLKYLKDNDISFENTEIIVVQVGGEECGLRGSKDFFASHPEMINDGIETVFLGVDTIRDEEFITVYDKDMTGMVKNDIRVCNLVRKAGAEHGIEIEIAPIPIGSTDAAAASQVGIPATSIVAMDPAPARYYHTRLDDADNLMPETIEKTLKVVLETVFSFDENGLN